MPRSANASNDVKPITVVIRPNVRGPWVSTARRATTSEAAAVTGSVAIRTATLRVLEFLVTALPRAMGSARGPGAGPAPREFAAADSAREAGVASGDHDHRESVTRCACWPVR